MRRSNGVATCTVSSCGQTPTHWDAGKLASGIVLCAEHVKAWDDSGERRRADAQRIQAILDFVRRVEAEEWVGR